MVRGFSRFVPFLFLGLLRAPTRNSPERVRDTIWTFPEKVGNTRVWKPPGLASESLKRSGLQFFSPDLLQCTQDASNLRCVILSCVMLRVTVLAENVPRAKFWRNFSLRHGRKTRRKSGEIFRRFSSFNF